MDHLIPFVSWLDHVGSKWLLAKGITKCQTILLWTKVNVRCYWGRIIYLDELSHARLSRLWARFNYVLFMLKIALHVVNAADIKQQEPASPKKTHLPSSWSPGPVSRDWQGRLFSLDPGDGTVKRNGNFGKFMQMMRWSCWINTPLQCLSKFDIVICHMSCYVMLCGNGSGFWPGRGISTARVFFLKVLCSTSYFLWVCVSSYILGTTQSSWVIL